MFNERPYKDVYKVTNESINGFFDQHRYLSNFHMHPVWYEGLLYPSSEHAYQAAKHPECMRYLFQVGTAANSKKQNRKLELSPKEIQSFDKIKVEVMSSILLNKFSDPVLRLKLFDTRGKYLEETNYWNDRFWGVCEGKGKNNLGYCLMNVRAFYHLQSLQLVKDIH